MDVKKSESILFVGNEQLILFYSEEHRNILSIEILKDAFLNETSSGHLIEQTSWLDCMGIREERMKERGRIHTDEKFLNYTPVDVLLQTLKARKMEDRIYYLWQRTTEAKIYWWPIECDILGLDDYNLAFPLSCNYLFERNVYLKTRSMFNHKTWKLERQRRRRIRKCQKYWSIISYNHSEKEDVSMIPYFLCYRTL